MKINRIEFPKPNSIVSKIPLLASKLSAGFPSAADDFIEQKLDLNEYLIKHPAATIFAWAQGDSLIDRGIACGDLLIIDRSVDPVQNCLVVASLDGELTCKVFDKRRGLLLAANKDYPDFDIKGREDVYIEGVIIYNLKSHL